MAPAGTCPASSRSPTAPPPCSWYAAPQPPTWEGIPGGDQGSGLGIESPGWHLCPGAVPCPFTWAIWPPVPTVRLCALQPGASWIADCTRHHCGNTPLGAVLVRSPISCPPLNETECAKVSASLLLSRHGPKRYRVSAVLLVGGVGGWGGPVCGGERGGGHTCPATPTPHLSMCSCSDHVTPHILTHHTAGRTQMYANVILTS